MKVYHIRDFDKSGKLLRNEAFCVPEYNPPFFEEFDIKNKCEITENFSMEDFGKYLMENENKEEFECLGKNKCVLRKDNDKKFSGEENDIIVRRVDYKVVKGPPVDAFKRYLKERKNKVKEIIESTPRDKMLAKIGLMGFDERVTYCSIVYPPITDVVKSDKPILNAAYKEDINERGYDIHVFPFSKVSTRIVVHSSKFEDGYPDSIQVVTRYMYTPVMQQMVSLPTNIVGRENLIRAIDDWLKDVLSESSENEDFKWNAEDIVKSAEKQKEYLETLSVERKPKKGDKDVFGLETGVNFELPEEVSIYLNKKDKLKVYELFGVVV